MSHLFQLNCEPKVGYSWISELWNSWICDLFLRSHYLISVHSFFHGWEQICVEAWKLSLWSQHVCVMASQWGCLDTGSQLCCQLSRLQCDTVGLSHLHTLNINTLLLSNNDSNPESIITCVHVDIPRPQSKHMQAYCNMKKGFWGLFLEQYCHWLSFFSILEKLTSIKMMDRVRFIPALSHLFKAKEGVATIVCPWLWPAAIPPTKISVQGLLPLPLWSWKADFVQISERDPPSTPLLTFWRSSL